MTYWVKLLIHDERIKFYFETNCHFLLMVRWGSLATTSDFPRKECTILSHQGQTHGIQVYKTIQARSFGLGFSLTTFI